MKVFLLKFFLFIIICCLIVMVCGSGRLDKKNQSDFMGAIIDKHRRLDSLTGSRIIFAGGSNLSLGQNSRLIEEEIKMPVVNLGLHAGLGLDFVLNELKSVIKSGDVVFLSIEYYLGKGDYKLQKHTAKGFPAAEDFIPITGFSQKIKYVIDKQMTNVHENAKYLFLKIKNDNNTPQEKVYDRKCFNKYGDDTAIYNITTTSTLADRGAMAYSYWDGIDKINQFYSFAQKNQVQVFFLYPQYPESEYKLNVLVITKYSDDLSKHLLVPIINTPTDFILADSLFFDTVYHLNGKGVNAKNKKLIEIIRSKNNIIHLIN